MTPTLFALLIDVHPGACMTMPGAGSAGQGAALL
jgi:hypothetical protein